MSPLNRTLCRRSYLFLSLAAPLAVACQPPPAAPAPAAELNLIGAARAAADDLTNQLGPAGGPARSVVIDPFVEGKTGQQTNASARVERLLVSALGNARNALQVLPFDDKSVANSRMLISGTLNAQPDPDRYRLSIALTDRSTGIVIAQTVTAFREGGLDHSPTRFYGDSPSLVRDRSVEGYLRTTETQAGKPADALYMEQVPTAAVLAKALTSYNEEKWQEALDLYQVAVARPDGQQLRTFNGIYLCNIQLGRLPEAEEAFGKIAALGLATNNLAVKLLFRPGSTEFWPDPKINGVYPMWLRQIARAAQNAQVCLNVVGHTSKSGTEAINDRLSLSRATSVRSLLIREAPSLWQKSQVSGVGFRENLVGSGKDDASDAIDRRVEFKVVACAT